LFDIIKVELAYKAKGEHGRIYIAVLTSEDMLNWEQDVDYSAEKVNLWNISMKEYGLKTRMDKMMTMRISSNTSE
jgi:hypothetical protein